MRKCLSGIVAIVLAITFSAFNNPPLHANTDDPVYGKTTSDGTQLVIPLDSFQGNETDARAHFDCPTSGLQFCARQVSISGQIISGGAFIKRD